MDKQCEIELESGRTIEVAIITDNDNQVLGRVRNVTQRNKIYFYSNASSCMDNTDADAAFVDEIPYQPSIIKESPAHPIKKNENLISNGDVEQPLPIGRISKVDE